jgi:cytochrome c oxidase subunit 3
LGTTIKTAGPPGKTGWTGAGNGNGSGGWNGGGGGSGGGRPRNGVLGMWFALAGIMMLFMALTSAYVVRRGLDPDWQAIRMPALAVVNAAILLASSVTFEQARRAMRRGARAADRWLFATWSLGLAFVAGQLVVWRQLADAGLYLSNNAHSSFFYVLTALHAAHLAGGILALSWLMWMPPAKMALSPGGSYGVNRGPASLADRERWTGVAALYWHFMDGLWVYLLLLLFAFK